MSELMIMARDQLHGFQDEWTVICQPWRDTYPEGTTVEDVVNMLRHFESSLFEEMDAAKRCEKDPETYVKEVNLAIQKVKTAAERMQQADADHKTILQGLAALHKQVLDLLDSAGGWRGEPKTQHLLPDLLEPRSCEGLARCMGEGTRHPVQISPMCSRTILRQFVAHVGAMNVQLGRQRSRPGDAVPLGKFKGYRDALGEVREHVPEFWSKDDSPSWIARSSEWIGQVVDEYM